MNLFQGYGVEVKLARPEDFLRVKETLTRIGIASRDNTLSQSCHILHKQRRYAIMHFKELFAFDGKPSNIEPDDIARRNTIANLLAQWKLVTLVDPEASREPVVTTDKLRIISHHDKMAVDENGKPVWNLVTKYSIGRKKGQHVGN
jgi:hypothetical protein